MTHGRLRPDYWGEWAHLCVDMQVMFEPGQPWGLAWMPRVVPHIVKLCKLAPERIVFTRFLPPEDAGSAPGTWQRVYEKWPMLTASRLREDVTVLTAALARFVPPAEVIDKMTYSPWIGSKLEDVLKRRKVETLVITGGETDVCVMGALLGAIDRGFRTILVQDAICSSSDTAHDAVLNFLSVRFSQQLEIGFAADVIRLGAREA